MDETGKGVADEKNMSRRSFVLGVGQAAALAGLALAGCGSQQAAPSDEGSDAPEEPEPVEEEAEVTPDDNADPYSTGNHGVTIEVEGYGTIELVLHADFAPITVSNFAKLVNEGFYDGLTFHRIISGFMIQGGDPNGDGTGGSEETIKGEFAANGVDNPISHVRGTISMARSTSYDSASSQFFIMHADGTFLDGQYAGFGNVTSGMEVVDAICADAEPIDDNGTIVAEDQPIITSIRMKD